MHRIEKNAITLLNLCGSIYTLEGEVLRLLITTIFFFFSPKIQVNRIMNSKYRETRI